MESRNVSNKKLPTFILCDRFNLDDQFFWVVPYNICVSTSNQWSNHSSYSKKNIYEQKIGNNKNNKNNDEFHEMIKRTKSKKSNRDWD